MKRRKQRRKMEKEQKKEVCSEGMIKEGRKTTKMGNYSNNGN